MSSYLALAKAFGLGLLYSMGEPKYYGTSKEYGLYLLRSGKNKYNDRKRKHYAKAWA